MAKNKLIAPFLKWVGGKRQIMPSITSLMPENINDYTYIEPFIGGGAVLFHLEPERAILNDSNSELINVYEVIRNQLGKLIRDLKKHENTPDYFYAIRNLDRTEEFRKLSPIQRASRFIYLNKTCFNGLYRVNSAGKFNTPFGRYKKPNIVNEPVLTAVSSFLNTYDIQLRNSDYETILKEADISSFIYLDPPYHPISESSNFTGYVQGGWNMADQIRLKEACDVLTHQGIKFLLSNSSSDFIKDLYTEYSIHTVKANRSINSKGEKRGEIDEVLICNYE